MLVVHAKLSELQNMLTASYRLCRLMVGRVLEGIQLWQSHFQTAQERSSGAYYFI